MIVSHRILLRTWKFSNKSCTENQNTRCMFKNFFPQKSCHFWHTCNVEKYGMPRETKDDNIILCICFACCITKATEALRIYNTSCFSKAIMVMRMSLNVTFIHTLPVSLTLEDCVWNVIAHAQKPDFVFLWNGWVHLNWQRLQFSWLLATEVCASAIAMLNTPCSIHQFPFHFPSRASPCAITFQLDSTKWGVSFQLLDPVTLSLGEKTTNAGINNIHEYKGCFKKNMLYLGRKFLKWNYINNTKNTYIRQWTATKLQMRAKSGLPVVKHTVLD